SLVDVAEVGRVGPRVDAAAVIAGELIGRYVGTVEDLNLVQPHQFDAGVRALRDQEVRLHLDILERLLGEQIPPPAATDDQPGARLDGQLPRVGRVEGHGLGHLPAGRIRPSGEVGPGGEV